MRFFVEDFVADPLFCRKVALCAIADSCLIPWYPLFCRKVALCAIAADSAHLLPINFSVCVSVVAVAVAADYAHRISFAKMFDCITSCVSYKVHGPMQKCSREWGALRTRAAMSPSFLSSRLYLTLSRLVNTFCISTILNNFKHPSRKSILIGINGNTFWKHLT